MPKEKSQNNIGSTEIQIKDESAPVSSKHKSNQKLNVRFISKDTGYVDDHQNGPPADVRKEAPLAGKNIRQNT